MANGLCITCLSDADCLASSSWRGDGGEVPGQISCDIASGLCVTPFSCARNSDCPGHGGNNCQVGGSCMNCVVGYTSSTCGSSDAGETPGQINCNQASLICVNSCNTNSDCVGTQGSNCMSNGLCLSCRSAADCLAANNNWGGDGGEIKGQTLCGANGICISACTGNFGTGGSNPCTSSTQGNCMSDGTCRACTNDQDCNANDGPPPGVNKNIVCNINTGICQDPYSCGTNPVTSTDNAGCQAQFPGQSKSNCWADGSCLSCTNNNDCFSRDGGRVPKQPRCDLTSGTCVGCQSNADCPSSAPNCNSDGFCYDCRTFSASSTCGSLDGPPGARAQPNCDTQTGICVDFCTADAHCLDACLPRCQLDRGCCVECTKNSDCPVNQWRGSERNKTLCDTDLGYICVNYLSRDTPTPAPVIGCAMDSHCLPPTPACSPTQSRCVQCLFDTHCSSPTPACSTNTQTCVGCTSDSHCSSGYYCDGDMMCKTIAFSYVQSGTSLVVGLSTFLSLLSALLF
eukprot:TRINITY_DN69_c0_g1_i8.p1 TRINITY_DN69_c0_g1~~TRINITY_DN69_c0_g1_i8.p1  ORF type:complete len:513 (+),score=104.15 TRINITY_DN69_c0_g1_i8:677-2215(+)